MDFDFQEQLKYDPSRNNADFVTHIIGADLGSFMEVFNLIYSSPHPINQRAANVVETCTREHKEFLLLLTDYMIDTFNDFNIDGVRRAFMKIFSRTDFNDDQSGRLIKICFDCMNDNKESIAVRVFGMQTLYNISRVFPDIKHELILTIENGMHLGIPAWSSRGSNLLKKLYREIE